MENNETSEKEKGSTKGRVIPSMKHCWFSSSTAA
jgi:hypothetical protein